MTEAEIRADERTRCWREIDALIVQGELPPHAHEERNGLILAANAILALKGTEPCH